MGIDVFGSSLAQVADYFAQGNLGVQALILHLHTHLGDMGFLNFALHLNDSGLRGSELWVRYKNDSGLTVNPAGTPDFDAFVDSINRGETRKQGRTTGMPR